MMMLNFKTFLLIGLVSFGLSLNAGCPTPNAPQAADSAVFVGSTPCDSLIRSIIGIPQDAPCDYIKWVFRLQDNSAEFQLNISYGEYLINTQLFQHGGTSMAYAGKYKIIAGQDSARRIYYLSAEKMPAQLILVRFDENIFHFADREKKLMVGNSGFGYVLNRLIK